MKATRDAALKTKLFYLIVIGLGVVGTVAGTLIAGSVGVSATELQTKLIQGCKETRKPLSSYFRGEVTQTLGEIEQTAQTDPALFPDIPPSQFSALIAQSIAEDFERIQRLTRLAETFDPAECPEQYR